MQSSENQKTEKYLSDVNHHLEDLKLGVNSLQLDFNQNKTIYLFCDKVLQKLGLIERVLNKNRLQLPILISTEVNDLFSKDENLSSVTIQLVNSKRLLNPSGIAYLKITV